MPEGFASFFTNASGGGGPGARGFSYNFHFTKPEDVFANAFRDGGLGSDIFDDILFGGARSSAGASTSPGGGARRPRGSFGENMRTQRAATPEVTTIERPLPVSLEDLYKGVTKKMKIKRKMFDDNNKRTTTDAILEVPIKPGLKKGSKIRFKGVGDQEEGGQQDLVFVIEEVSYRSPRTVFTPQTSRLTKLQNRNRILSSSATATTSSTRLTWTSKRP